MHTYIPWRQKLWKKSRRLCVRIVRIKLYGVINRHLTFLLIYSIGVAIQVADDNENKIIAFKNVSTDAVIS